MKKKSGISRMFDQSKFSKSKKSEELNSKTSSLKKNSDGNDEQIMDNSQNRESDPDHERIIRNKKLLKQYTVMKKA